MNDLEDELLTTAARLLSGKSEVSLSFIQLRLRVGYTRAAMIMDTLEKRGIIGPPKGGMPRDILPPVRCDQHADNCVACEHRNTPHHVAPCRSCPHNWIENAKEKSESRAGIPPFENGHDREGARP